MSDPIIKIKRSSVPGKKPTVENTSLGELLINTHDADLYSIRNRPGIGTDVVNLSAGINVTNILYVTQDGNDSNTGKKLGDAKRTIGAALTTATTGTVIKVSAGSYLENNPLVIPEQVSIVGDSLREVSVSPQNADQDLFYVSNGNYIAEMSYTGTLNSGKAIFAFNPNKVGYFDQSPYIQNCTNFIPNSIGMRVDGSKAIGPLKSMVLDSYTQYNQNGIGASITNQGYAQLVSLFTICNDIAVYVGSGGGCDLTNSNSSFGNYGLVADGVGPLRYEGVVVDQVLPSNGINFVTVDLSTPVLNITNAEYDNNTGILTAFTNNPHNFSVGMSISLSGLGFTCESGPGIVTYPSGNKGYLFETITVSPSRYIDAYNLIQLNRQEIIDSSYNAISTTYPSFINPDPDKCKRDLGYIIDSVSVDIRDFTNQNTINATKFYFKYNGSELITNGIAGEVPQTIVGFTSARDLMKLAITNNLTIKDLSIQADPITQDNTDLASCADVQSFIDNLVGIITTRLDAGNIVGVNTLPNVSTSSTIFSAYVGISTLSHTYTSGGIVSINSVKPFDGLVSVIGDAFYTVKEIVVGSGGTGYTEDSIAIIIDPPETDWGISANAVGIVTNGSLDTIELVSSGRGYTNIPKVTIPSPNNGINTANVSVIIEPSYYIIESSTPISSGICTIFFTENIEYPIESGTKIYFYKQSRLLASGHSFEYIGSGTDISTSLPQFGGTANQNNESVLLNGGLVVYTSTDQAGNFRIGDGVVINQQTGTIAGTFYSKSLFSAMTPFILALGGE